MLGIYAHKSHKIKQSIFITYTSPSFIFVSEKDTGLFLSQSFDQKLISISNRVLFYKKIALFTKLLSRRRSLGEFAAVITFGGCRPSSKGEASPPPLDVTPVEASRTDFVT